MPNAIRTKPTSQAPHFAELAAKLSKLMQAWGLQERKKQGSVSWVCRQRGGYDTVFKLVHLGDGAMLLGMNKASLEKNDQLRRLSWPVTFSVAPQIHVEFRGFRATNDEAFLSRTRHVLCAYRKPDSALAAMNDSVSEQQFFEELKQLNEEDALTAGSVSAIAAVLPVEDFSDWES